jgi:2-methylcitrate dehydratase PrpD
VQYALSRALVNRKVALPHFEGETYKDAAVRAILPRIHVAPYTTEQFPADNHFAAEVNITLKNGTVLKQKVDQPFGRTSKNALPPELLKEKFVNCSTMALPAAQVEKLYAAIQGIDALKDVRELSALAAVAPTQARVAARA